MPDVKPFIITGLALGGVYALSGVGIVVLYRTTGVLNLAYGAIGAMGALISWTLVNDAGWATWPAVAVAVAFGGFASLLYGVTCAPVLAQRDELVKATGTLGYALLLLGVMLMIWGDDPRSLTFPLTEYGFFVGTVRVTATQLLAIGLAVAVTVFTVLYLHRARLGIAMRALADDRAITAMLGVPARWVEASAWLVSGILCGISGVLLASLIRLEAVTLTFLVISFLAAALVGSLRSLWWTLAGGLVIGLVEGILTPFSDISPYRTITPFAIAIVVLLWINRGRPMAVTEQAT
jgi:branched-chain amino acid transport system permease protein